MAKLNLLPRKEFEITLGNGTVIKGQWGTWATKRMCQKLNCKLYEITEKFSPVKKDKDGNIELDDKHEPIYLPAEIEVYCEFLLCAVEQKSRQDKAPFSYTDVDACAWMDELGGRNSENMLSIIRHSSDETNTEQKKTTEETG